MKRSSKVMLSVDELKGVEFEKLILGFDAPGGVDLVFDAAAARPAAEVAVADRAHTIVHREAAAVVGIATFDVKECRTPGIPETASDVEVEAGADTADRCQPARFCRRTAEADTPDIDFRADDKIAELVGISDLAATEDAACVVVEWYVGDVVMSVKSTVLQAPPM